jgi:hypothetical protein
MMAWIRGHASVKFSRLDMVDVVARILEMMVQSSFNCNFRKKARSPASQFVLAAMPPRGQYEL